MTWCTQALGTAETEGTTPEDREAALAAAKADFMSALELGNLAKDASDGEKMTAAASYAGLRASRCWRVCSHVSARMRTPRLTSD